MSIDAFMHIPIVEGESTRKGFEKKIEIWGFNFGAENRSTIGPGSEGAGGGRAVLQNFSIKKAVDKASPLLFQHCASGEHVGYVEVSLMKAGGEEAVNYLTYKFENCYIESVRLDGSAMGHDDRPTESVSIAYGKVTITYHPQSGEGTTKPSALIGSWDITKVST